MTDKMICCGVLVVLMYGFLIWMIKCKRKRLEMDGIILTKTEIWLVVGGIILLVVSAIMLIVEFQLATGKSKAVSVMVGCIVVFLLAFFPPNNRLFAYLFELFVENGKRKKAKTVEKSKQGKPGTDGQI